MEAGIFVFVLTSIISSLGTLYLGTYGLINAILNIFLLPVYAYNNSVLTLVAKNKDVSCAKSALNILAFYIIGLFILFAFFGKNILSLITPEYDLVNLASSTMFFVLLSQVFNISNLILKSALNGLRDEIWVTKYNLVITIITATILYVLVRYQLIQLRGIYLVLGVSYLLLTLGYLIRIHTSMKVD